MRKPVWTEAKKDRVRRFTAYWLQEFGFLPLIVDIRFRNYREKVSCADGDASMGIRYDYPYRTLIIEVFPPVANYSNEKLIQTVLHEMLHIALARLKSNRFTEDKRVWATLEEESVDLIMLVMSNHLKELKR